MKSNRGRKCISDKKIQISIYIEQSKIEQNQGIEELKVKLHEYIDFLCINTKKKP